MGLTIADAPRLVGHAASGGSKRTGDLKQFAGNVGRVAFTDQGQTRSLWRETIRITGGEGIYRIEVGLGGAPEGRLPSLAQIHETVQTTLLPAVGAYHTRAA